MTDSVNMARRKVDLQGLQGIPNEFLIGALLVSTKLGVFTLEVSRRRLELQICKKKRETWSSENAYSLGVATVFQRGFGGDSSRNRDLEAGNSRRILRPNGLRLPTTPPIPTLGKDFSSLPQALLGGWKFPTRILRPHGLRLPTTPPISAPGREYFSSMSRSGWLENHGLPSKFAWREMDLLTKVKYQGKSYTCFAHATTTVVEYALQIHTKEVLELSLQPQELWDARATAEKDEAYDVPECW